MENYNALISAKILDNYDRMIDVLPQPEMFGRPQKKLFGGARVRNFVLPGSTESDYPGTLSVGRMDGQKPDTLGADFWNEFGDGFPEGSLSGGRRKNPFGKIMKSVGKEVAPIAKDLGTTLAKEGIKEGVKSYAKSGSTATGGRRKKNIFGKVMKSVGKEVAPIAKDLGKTLAKEGLKEGIKAMKAKPSGNSDEMIVGKGRRGRKPLGADPSTYTPANLEGGVLVKLDDNSVYPPNLSKGSARGGARPKKASARGALISQVMKKHGLSLGEASKFIKEKGLY